MALPIYISLGKGNNFSLVFAFQCFTNLYCWKKNCTDKRYYDILLLNDARGNRGLLSIRRDGIISPRMIICGKKYCEVYWMVVMGSVFHIC